MKVNKKIAVLTVIMCVLVILSLGKVQAFGNQLEENDNIVQPQNSVGEALSQNSVIGKDNEIVDKTSDKTKNATVDKTNDNTKNNADEDKDDEANTETTSTDWTDFSNAKIELKKNSNTLAVLEISNIKLKGNRSYWVYISSNNNKPTILREIDGKFTTPQEQGWKVSSGNNNNNTLRVGDMEEYVVLNQDIYISVAEYDEARHVYNINLYGKKVDKFEQPKYSDAFSATYMSDNECNIVLNFTHYTKNKRNLQFKIGKITDKSILEKIKNNNNSGFEELLMYSKNDKFGYSFEKSNAEMLELRL